MSELVKQAIDTKALAAAVAAHLNGTINASDAYLNAMAALAAVDKGVVVESDGDAAQASDTALLLKRGEAKIESALRDTFAGIKALERMVRDEYAPARKALGDAIEKLDAARHAWRRKEEARVREEQVMAQRLADEAARAAAEAAATDDDAPEPAQIVAPKLESVTRGAIGKTHTQRKVVAQEIRDPVALAKAWPHAIVLSPEMRKVLDPEFTVLLKRGTVDYPGESGLEVNGVLYVTKVTFVDGSGR